MSSEYSIQLNLPIEDIRNYCETLPIERLALFGSVLRDDFTHESDVDMLVDYLPDAKITLLDMAAQEIALSEIIQRKVDLRTTKELSPHFRQDVIETAWTLYERQ